MTKSDDSDFATIVDNGKKVVPEFDASDPAAIERLLRRVATGLILNGVQADAVAVGFLSAGIRATVMEMGPGEALGTLEWARAELLKAHPDAKSGRA